jgi:hypothetical protein
MYETRLRLGTFVGIFEKDWEFLSHSFTKMNAMEDMTSLEFRKAVKEENRRWKEVLEPLQASVNRWKESMEDLQAVAYPETPTFAPISFSWQGRPVRKQAGSAGYSVNLWVGSWKKMAIANAGFGKEYFYTIEDIGEGAEVYKLTVWHCTVHSKTPKKLWSHHPVGPTAVIQDDHIYYCGVENKLRYSDVWCVDITGKHKVQIFEEPDKRIQVSVLERGGAVFVHTANALEQRLGILDPTGVTWIVEESSTLIPLGPESWATNTAFVKKDRTIEFPVGYFLEDVILVGDTGNEAFFVLVKEGQDSLWGWSEGWRQLIEPPQGLLTHIQIFHEPTVYPRFLFRAPMVADSVWEYRKYKLHRVFSYPEPVQLHYFQGGSAPYFLQGKKIQIPYTWVSAVPNPHGLIVEAYGAYGISSRRAYPIRWLAYLAAGWAFAYVCPRGGREGGDAWYDGGRTALRKHHTFLDTEYAIRHIQEDIGIGPERTVFFGRSAGGWLAARLAQDYGGDLVAAVYTEVPYVDVLATTGNPDLPLTQLEYDEFGDPRKPVEKAALRRLSPVDTVKPCKHMCPTLVIRTALHDSQVYPYESLKWAKKLRAAGWKKVYVGIDGGGHFAAANVMVQQRAEDAAILEEAVGNHVYHPSRIPTLPIHYIRNVPRSRKTLRKSVAKRSGLAGKSGTIKRRL